MRIERHESEDDLLMDLYFPSIITGMYGDPDSGSEILEKVKEVDGDGSGLDADMVDGRHGSEFLLRRRDLSGCVVVCGDDGDFVSGGSFEDFKVGFLSNGLSVLK